MSNVDFAIVRSFLQQRAAAAAKERILAGVGILVFGLLLVGVSFAVVYVVLKYCVDPLVPLSMPLRILAGLLIVGLLFVGNTLTGKEETMEYTVMLAPGQPELRFSVLKSGLLSDTTDTPYGVFKLISDCICVGPRTVSASFRNFRKASRLKNMDLDGCAAVLTVLLMNESRVPFPKIYSSIEGLDPVKVFPQMGDIEGVMFLKKEPQGLSLNSDFRNEFQQKTGIDVTSGG